MITDKLIQEHLLLGFTLKEIAKKYNVTHDHLIHKYKIVKKDFKYITNFNKESYHGFYVWDDLSLEEKKAYFEYEEKNKAFYEF